MSDLRIKRKDLKEDFRKHEKKNRVVVYTEGNNKDKSKDKLSINF